MNIYRTEFFADCPVNGVRIKYALRIDSSTPIAVEAILAAVKALPVVGYHEHLADMLKDSLPGFHVLGAHHHGVDIETRRPAATQASDESGQPGLYRTPGY